MMKPMKPDSLLPFAIAAILGFLVLGLNGGERQSSSKIREPSPPVESVRVDNQETPKSSPDLRVEMDAFRSRSKQ